MATLIAGCGAPSSPSIEITNPSEGTRLDPGNIELSVRNLNSNSVVDTDFKIKQVAVLAAPSIGDFALQATDVIVHGDFAFVSYNRQGSDQMGGVDIVDISNPSKPVLRSQLLLKDRDVNAVVASNDEVFIVGANRAEDEGPAYLAKISYKDGRFEGDLTSVWAPGYAGTDIVIQDDIVFVSSGDRAGVFGYRIKDLMMVSKEEIYDARAIAINSCEPTRLSVLTGQPAELSIFQTHAKSESYPIFELLSHYDLGGAKTPEAKSTLQMGQNYALASQGEAGFSIVCKESGKILSQNPVETSDAVAAEDSATNAVSAMSGLIFAANGGAGLHVYSAKVGSQNPGCSGIETHIIGRVDFGHYASANHVFATKKMIFVASGLGGLKILTLDRSTGKKDLVDFDEDQGCDK
jgi:hypothetical protein